VTLLTDFVNQSQPFLTYQRTTPELLDILPRMGTIPQSLKKFHKQLPKFADGRIDYTNAREAAVLTCFIECQGKILLLKRSNRVGAYKGLWNTVAGYLDELRPLEDKVKEELKEELGILENEIKELKLGEMYAFTDKEINKTWIIHPVLINLKAKPNIKLDWEHTEYIWIFPNEITNYHITPKLDESLKRVMP